MISRYELWLNDSPLSGIDPDILILDISYDPVKRQYNQNRVAARDGAYSSHPYIAENVVTVTFEAHKYGTADRQSVVQAVNFWASSGGWLKTSDKPGKRMYVRTTQFAAVQSARNWTDPVSVVFTAYDYPFWQDESPLTVSLDSGDSETVNLVTAFPVDVEALVTAAGAVSAFTVTCGDTSIAFSGLSLSSGDTVRISYTDDRHIMNVTGADLAKRTAASSDDLKAGPGANTVSFTSTGTASCELYFRGVTL